MLAIGVLLIFVAFCIENVNNSEDGENNLWDTIAGVLFASGLVSSVASIVIWAWAVMP